jgi:hypothetical protein
LKEISCWARKERSLAVATAKSDIFTGEKT